MIRQRASAPRSKERRSRQQQQLPLYHNYQHPTTQSQENYNNDTVWERDEEEEATRSTTTNNSGDFVDEELGEDEPCLANPPLQPPPTLPQSVQYSAQSKSQSSYYSTLNFQVPDSKYREHHMTRLHHHRHVRLTSSSSSSSSPPPSKIYNSSSQNGSKQPRFLFFFSSPREFAIIMGWFSLTAMMFLLLVGVLIDRQPLYIRGVLPRETLQHPHALRKFKVVLPTSKTRLDPAKHAYQAALAYLVTLCVCWIYGYNGIERLVARIRRRHYRDIPDHYYPDDIHGNNNHHHHHLKGDNVMSNVASMFFQLCSRICNISHHVWGLCLSNCGIATRNLQQQQQQQQQQLSWRSRCLGFVWWWQRQFIACGDVCLRTVRRATTMRYYSKVRSRTRRATTTGAASSNNSAAATTSNANATTATQRKRRKNMSHSPPRRSNETEPTTAATSSGKHKHG